MKTLALVLLVILGITQYALWFSKSGIREYFLLKHQIESAQQKNMASSLKNQMLANEVRHLKSDKAAVEAHARHDLGMIKKGEVFYQIVPLNPGAQKPSTLSHEKHNCNTL